MQADRLKLLDYQIQPDESIGETEIDFQMSGVTLPFYYELHSLFHLKSPVNKRQRHTLSVKSHFLNLAFRKAKFGN